MIKWTATHEESRLIIAIAKRAAALEVKHTGFGMPTGEWMMDLTAAHLNGNRLELELLLSTDDANFAHDVFGIRRHIDRTTGKLLDCFVPRFTAAEVPS